MDKNEQSVTLAERRSAALEPPASVVSIATGACGLVGLAIAFAVIAIFKIPLVPAAVISLAATFLPMLLWTALVEKTWKNPSTGLDFSQPRTHDETMETTKLKLIGLLTTWVIICLLYFVRERPPGLGHPAIQRTGFGHEYQRDSFGWRSA